MWTRALILCGCVVAALDAVAALSTRLPPGDYTPQRKLSAVVAPAAARQLREDALRRARVWSAPKTPVGMAGLANNPPDVSELGPDEGVVCKFLPSRVRGTTPKFDCILAGGEVIKVKYGANPEIQAELAATRLLAALGFGADRMYRVKTLRCFGCPAAPFRILQVLDMARLGDLYRSKVIDYDKFSDFENVAVERPLPGRAVETDEHQGWAWFELDKIEPRRGGASRAELDALRLMVMVLGHWDNKAKNQRLVCLPGGGRRGDPSCRRPFAMLHDLGATFGPRKVDLDAWRWTPIWEDASRCHVSMKSLPYEGGTFGEATISESGRRLLAQLLGQLSEAQIRDLFLGAGFPAVRAPDPPAADVTGWVQAFQAKVREIDSAGPCPVP